MIPTFRIFIGYDGKEPLAYAVLSHSILRRASQPVSITPIAKHHLKREYTREKGPTEATEFSLTRFLVPYLSDYTGFSLFLDCDILCQADIGDIMLYPLAEPGKAVYVAKHDYVPKSLTKFLGNEQTVYPKKNWSSVMLFDNTRCTSLTKEYVNTAPGLDLHRFNWLKSDEEIGSLPLSWNHLVDEYPENHEAELLHYTLGGPWFEETKDCPQANAWVDEKRRMLGE